MQITKKNIKLYKIHTLLCLIVGRHLQEKSIKWGGGHN